MSQPLRQTSGRAVSGKIRSARAPLALLVLPLNHLESAVQVSCCSGDLVKPGVRDLTIREMEDHWPRIYADKLGSELKTFTPTKLLLATANRQDAKDAKTEMRKPVLIHSNLIKPIPASSVRPLGGLGVLAVSVQSGLCSQVRGRPFVAHGVTSPFRDPGDFAFDHESRTHHVSRVGPPPGPGLLATDTEQEFSGLDYAAALAINDRHLSRR